MGQDKSNEQNRRINRNNRRGRKVCLLQVHYNLSRIRRTRPNRLHSMAHSRQGRQIEEHNRDLHRILGGRGEVHDCIALGYQFRNGKSALGLT